MSKPKIPDITKQTAALIDLVVQTHLVVELHDQWMRSEAIYDDPKAFDRWCEAVEKLRAALARVGAA